MDSIVTAHLKAMAAVQKPEAKLVPRRAEALLEHATLGHGLSFMNTLC